MTENQTPSGSGEGPRVVYVERQIHSDVKPGLSAGTHFLHFIMTVGTFGVWLPVWVIHAAIAGNRGRS